VTRFTDLLKGAGKFTRDALEFSNILLTTEDAAVGVTAKDVVWTFRKTTLYRYRSNQRRYPVPVLLTFALINRPDIFDLRPGNSFVEYLLEQGFDVFLVDWGIPGDEESDMGLDDYALDHLPAAVREVRRASGAKEITLVGWCMGAALSAIYLALRPDAPVRNFMPLTMPLDTEGSTYQIWMGRDTFDVDHLAANVTALPGWAVDTANKMMKPVPNFIGTPRRLWLQVTDGTVNKTSYQAMAKWVADNPPFPARAFAEWVTSMFKENALVSGEMEVRGERVDLGAITQSVLIVTASADHIAPRDGTLPLLDLLGSDDVEHMDRVGGHIGLMAGSKAKREIWPDIVNWLEPRSQ
jgi:polyhydroxyalkanoate synthase